MGYSDLEEVSYNMNKREIINIYSHLHDFEGSDRY
jgi:hypothetical protein